MPFNPFSRSKNDDTPPDNKTDDILGDLPRGEKGRNQHHDFQSFGYFEEPEVLAEIGFSDHAGDNFLGIIGGQSELVPRRDGGMEYKTTGGVPVGCRDDRHRTVIAGSRSGKGRSVIIPELLTYGGSAIVVDLKGENADRTAIYRAETLKQNVHVLDPFGITHSDLEAYRATFNPLTTLTHDNKNVAEDAARIAEALIVSTNEKDAHWDTSARMFIEGVILHVTLGSFKEERRTLATVAELLSGSIHELLDDMGQTMTRAVKAAAIAMEEKTEKERDIILSTIRKNLQFITYGSMEKCLSSHSFNLSELKSKPTTIYLVLPSRYMGITKQWLRLFVNLTLAEVETNPVKPEYPVQMIIDEMPMLGKMEELERAIAFVAGYGLRITNIFQDLSQLRAIYGEERSETFIGNSGIIQIFGTVDMTTSKWVSEYLDQTTILVRNEGVPSISGSEQGISGISYSSTNQQLMTPAEVRRYFARGDHYNRQLVLIPGELPYILQRANYDQYELFDGRYTERD